MILALRQEVRCEMRDRCGGQVGAELSEVLLIAPPDLARYGAEHTPAFVGFFPQLDGPLGRSEALKRPYRRAPLSETPLYTVALT